MQQYILTVDNYLKTIKQEDYELEFRFGEFRGQNFKSGVESNVFYRVLDHFLTHVDIYDYIPQDITLLTEKIEGKDLSGKPDLIVENIYVDSKNQRIREAQVKGHQYQYYTIKNTIKNIDNYGFYQRFSVSTEQPILKLPIDVTLQAVREKKRWSFAINKNLSERSGTFTNMNPFRVDLTHVTGWFIDYKGFRQEFNTFEVEMEIIKKPIKSAQELLGGIMFMLQLIQNTEYPISSFDWSRIASDYNYLFSEDISQLEKTKQTLIPNWTFNRKWKIYNPVNKPVNFKLDLLELPDKLAITDKADGQRKLMFIKSDGLYLVYPPNDINKFSLQSNSTISQTILDGELVGNIFLAFDILIYKGVDVRMKPFNERLKILKSIKLPERVELKEFYTGKFYDNINKLFEAIPKKKYGNDGIIINLIDETYNGAVYKWKPPELLTIDFYIDKVNETTFKIFVKDKNNLVPFVGTKKYPFSGTVETNDPLNTSQIVEMSWRGGKFVPLRVRHDRDQPNNLTTAINIWNDIMHPIEETTIRGTDLTMLRHFHNIIKRDLIQKCGTGNYLLDIGSGRGGDLHKWRASQLKVLAVEPSVEHIREFERRLSESGYAQQDEQWVSGETKVTILNTIGQDEDNIVNTFFKTFSRKADCASIFNALTFFFKDEENLDSLISVISQLLREDGCFIGMVMDGEAVKKLLNKKSIVEEASWKIKKLTDFGDTPYNNKIYIDLIDTIVQNQEEYLVDFNELVKKFAEKGITLSHSEMLIGEMLSPSQKKLYELYRIFEFKKSRLPPPHVQKDIIQETMIDERIKQMFVSLESEHLKELSQEEREPIKLFGKQFIRIGLSSDCILDAIARAVFTSFQLNRNEIKNPLTKGELLTRDKYSKLFYKKIVEKLKENYRNGTVLSYFSTWDEVSSHIQCDKLHLLNILNFIAKQSETNIIYIKYHDSVRQPSIERSSSNFKRTAVVMSHDTQFNTIALEKNGALITSFESDPFV